MDLYIVLALLVISLVVLPGFLILAILYKWVADLEAFMPSEKRTLDPFTKREVRRSLRVLSGRPSFGSTLTKKTRPNGPKSV